MVIEGKQQRSESNQGFHKVPNRTSPMMRENGGSEEEDPKRGMGLWQRKVYLLRRGREGENEEEGWDRKGEETRCVWWWWWFWW
jgi:hypothetical protein